MPTWRKMGEIRTENTAERRGFFSLQTLNQTEMPTLGMKSKSSSSCKFCYLIERDVNSASSRAVISKIPSWFTLLHIKQEAHYETVLAASLYERVNKHNDVLYPRSSNTMVKNGD